MSHRSLRSRRRRLLAAGSLVLSATVVALAGAGPASAGSYSAWLCKTPPEAPNPNTPTSTEGWEVSNNLIADIAMENSCASGGNIGLNFVRPAGSGTGLMAGGARQWVFTAPANTAISHVRMHYAYGVTANNSVNDYYGQAAVGLYRNAIVWPDNRVFDQLSDKTNYFTGGGERDFDVSSRTFGFNVGCYGEGQCGTSDLGRASMSTGWQRVDLTDDTNPTAPSIGGSALDPGTKSGTETVTLQTADTGSGVWGVEATLGSAKVVPFFVPSSFGGRCSAVNYDGAIPREFHWAKPCPDSANALLSFDTRAVADGDHLLTVTVTDAAGNSTPVISKKLTVRNTVATPTPIPAATPTPTQIPAAAATPTPTPGLGATPSATPLGGAGTPGTAGTAGLPNGTGGAPATGTIVGLVAPKTPTLFGKPLSLSGKVVDASGTPIAGAFVDVYTTVAVPGAQRTFAGTVTADASGTFTYAVATKSTTTVEFAYASKQASTDYVAQAKVAVPVRASVSLVVAASARRGQPVNFSGVLGVDPLPAKGARIVIEGKTAKGWITAAVVRTRKGGVFSWNHRFSTRGRYTLRARVLGASDLPAKVNHSPSRRLRIS